MKKRRLLCKLFIPILFAWIVPVLALAQVNVKGKVTDGSTGDPLPGVSVTIKGTTTGTSTDVGGNYSITAPSASSQIQFALLGYLSKTATASSTTLNMQLQEDVAKLDEVVITGLATSVKRSNLANSVATISSKELTGISTPQTLEGALNGKLAGANIVASSGAPGGGISVRLRGLTSVNSNTQPLYVVDGVIMDNSSVSSGVNTVTIASRSSGNSSDQDNPSNRIADINPEDIENIEVLKGASAAAIYGALAASGVIIITTKRGVEGKTKVSFSQDLGYSKAIKLLGVREWDVQKVQDFFESAGPAGVQQQVDFFNTAVASGKIYDYEKEMYGETGFLTSSTLSFSGGTERTKFFLSGLFMDEDGIIKETGYKKYSIRANIDQKISNRFNIAFTANYINSSTDRGLTNNDNAGVSYGVALSSTPTFMDLFQDPATGNFPRNRYAPSNPLETQFLMTNNESVNRFVGGLGFTAFLQQSDRSTTKLNLRGGLDYYTLATEAIFPNTLQFESDGNGTAGASIQGNTTNLNLNLAAHLVNIYTTSNQYYTFTTSAGATMENFDQNQILNVATILTGSQTNLDQASAIDVDQFKIPRKNRGLFLQEEVNFRDRVIIGGGIRFDKSTDNADVNNYEAFPKASIAVNLNNFDFWKSQNINALKLRAAYGESGNFPTYGAKFTSFSSSNIGGVGGTLIGVANAQGSIQQGNDEVQQERQKEFETGFDISFSEGKVAFDATYYNRKGENLIFAANIPSSSGFVQKIINGGTLQNEGVELGLNWLPFNNPNFKWNSRTSFWLNRSKMLRLDIPPYNDGGFADALAQFRIEEGKPVTQIIGFDDRNGDGEADVDANGAPVLYVLGDAEPDFQMSFANDFTIYKNFSLAFVLHWKSGNQNINLTEFLTDLGGTSPDYDADDDGNGVNNAAQRTGLFGVSSTPYVMDAHYLRLRDIGLYYTFPSNSLTNTFGGVVSGIKLGISATNLFTITPYKSYDPEVSNFGSGGFSTGVEVTPYPSARRMFFHLTVDF